MLYNSFCLWPFYMENICLKNLIFIIFPRKLVNKLALPSPIPSPTQLYPILPTLHPTISNHVPTYQSLSHPTLLYPALPYTYQSLLYPIFSPKCPQVPPAPLAAFYRFDTRIQTCRHVGHIENGFYRKVALINQN